MRPVQPAGGPARRAPRSDPIPLNSAIGLEPTAAPTEEAFARSLGPPARETLLVLAQDASLIATVRAVASSEHEVLFVGAETDLATQLVASGAGVAVIDSAATLSSITQLIRGLKRQFPDLVLIVAGGAPEQSALTAQVSSGEVYRFLHKPASEQRMRLFVDAAWRRREKGDMGGVTSTVAQLPQLAERRLPVGLIAGAAFAVAALAGLLGWLMGQHGTQKIIAPPIAISAVPHPAPLAAQAAPTDTVLKELLENASAALERGDWVMPAGSSAADLYRQALERHPGDAQALAGIDKVIDQVLSAAEQDLLAQRLDEAEHMTDAGRALAPNSPRVAFLSTQISRERERVTRAQAHQQAQQQQADALAHQQELIGAARAALTAGKLDDAAHAIDTAADGGANIEAIDALRRELQAARLAARVTENATNSAPPPAALAQAAPPQAQASSAAPAPAQTPPSIVPEPPAAQDNAAGGANAIVSAGTLERLRYVAPEYPKSAREQGTSGWVQLAFDVETDGSVANIAVLGSDPKNVFDAAATAALRRWRYRPVEKNGAPVEQRAQLRIRFALH